MSSSVEMQSRFYGLSLHDLRSLAFQFAERNGIDHPFKKNDKMAGKDWAYDTIVSCAPLWHSRSSRNLPTDTVLDNHTKQIDTHIAEGVEPNEPTHVGLDLACSSESVEISGFGNQSKQIDTQTVEGVEPNEPTGVGLDLACSSESVAISAHDQPARPNQSTAELGNDSNTLSPKVKVTVLDISPYPHADRDAMGKR
jgi:hypothetical protein